MREGLFASWPFGLSDRRRGARQVFMAPFHTTWNTPQLADNSMPTIRVEARDLAKNVGIKLITVTVQNGPQ